MFETTVSSISLDKVRPTRRAMAMGGIFGIQLHEWRLADDSEAY